MMSYKCAINITVSVNPRMGEKKLFEDKVTQKDSKLMSH